MCNLVWRWWIRRTVWIRDASAKEDSQSAEPSDWVVELGLSVSDVGYE